jgi:hypothetical protein
MALLILCDFGENMYYYYLQKLAKPKVQDKFVALCKHSLGL